MLDGPTGRGKTYVSVHPYGKAKLYSNKPLIWGLNSYGSYQFICYKFSTGINFGCVCLMIWIIGDTQIRLNKKYDSI